MSIKTWKDEFYPVRAAKTPKEDAVQHSILKWEGFRPKNMKKYDVSWDLFDLDLTDDNRHIFPTSSGTCALCQHYLDGNKCSKCPLYIVRDGTKCYERMDNEADSPYRVRSTKPHIMIRWLKRAKAYEDGQKKKEGKP